jgi:hypothetical protein
LSEVRSDVSTRPSARLCLRPSVHLIVRPSMIHAIVARPCIHLRVRLSVSLS